MVNIKANLNLYDIIASFQNTQGRYSFKSESEKALFIEENKVKTMEKATKYEKQRIQTIISEAKPTTVIIKSRKLQNNP